MNLGLGNRIELKAWLLPKSQRSDTLWDAAIDAIGLGVAAQLERHCDRKFGRVAGDTFQTDAARLSISLPRFPVESIATIQLSDDTPGTWTTLSGVIRAQDLPAGMVWLQDVQADYPAQLLVTYTGGYWFDDTEDSSGSQPSGSTARPAGLKLAWLEQCAAVWGAKDHTGQSLSDAKETPRVEEVPLTARVVDLLRPFLRYAA